MESRRHESSQEISKARQGRPCRTKKCTGVAVRRFSLYRVTRGNRLILSVSRVEECRLPAVLRIAGPRLPLERLISHGGFLFTESLKSRLDRKRDPIGHHDVTTFNLTVSDSSGDSVPQQIRDSEQFLASNCQAIAALLRTIPECSGVLDFSWNFPIQSYGQFNHFSTALMAMLVELGLELEISVYGTTEPVSLDDDGEQRSG